MTSVEEMRARLAAVGITLPPGRVRIECYGDSPELSAQLLELVRSGAKRATTALLWAMEVDGDVLPDVGDIEIVCDPAGEPVLITRMQRVDVVPFGSVTATHAALEGEADGSLASWREGHWAFFSRECARIGRVPSEDMPVVCAVFELLAQVPRLAP